MRNKTKKILNVLMAMIFLSQVMYADILDDAVKNMSSDVISVKSFTEGDGTQNYYSGSMSVRFSDVNPNQPLFSFTPPSIEVGCSGIDIKGMFLSLLGLEQLKDMLFNAGATLAWGVAVGLIYTLPGIANAFKFINGWAKKIQDLLADACNAGIEIGKWAGKEAKLNKLNFNDTINDFISSVGMDEYAIAKQKGKSSILEAMGWYDGETPELSPDKKEDAIVGMLRGMLESDSSMIGGIISDISTKASGQAVMAALNGVSDGAVKESKAVLNDGLVDSLAQLMGVQAGISGVSKAKLSLFSYVLIYNFVGDIASIKTNDGALTDLFNGINGSANGAAQLKLAEDLDQTQITFMSGKMGMSGNNDKAKGLAEFIWFGTEYAQASDDISETIVNKRENNRNLVAPIVTVYVLKDKNSAGKLSFIPILKYNENRGNSATISPYYTGSTNFKGTVMESKCAIDVLVAGSSNIVNDDGTEQKQKTLAECGTGLVFPELHKYVKIIQNSPNIEQYKLKHLLMQVMAVKMAHAILGSIGESLSAIKTSTAGGAIAVTGGNDGSTSNGAKKDINAVLKYREDISDVTMKAGYYLDDKLGGSASKEAYVDSVFNMQERKNRERGLKSLQK